MNHEEICADELLRRYASGERNFVGLYLEDGSVLRGAQLQGATFQHGFFSDVDARGACLRGTTFRRMNLKCTDFRDADLTDAVFDDVLIDHAAFKGAITERTVFSKMTVHAFQIEVFRPQEWDWPDEFTQTTQ